MLENCHIMLGWDIASLMNFIEGIFSTVAIWMATRGASCLFKVDIAEMKDASHHSEEIELLRVIQTDFLHGHHHPVEISQVIQQRVLQGTHFPMLQKQRAIKTHNTIHRSHAPQVPKKKTQRHCSYNQRWEMYSVGLYTDLDLWLKKGGNKTNHTWGSECVQTSFLTLSYSHTPKKYIILNISIYQLIIKIYQLITFRLNLMIFCLRKALCCCCIEKLFF